MHDDYKLARDRHASELVTVLLGDLQVSGLGGAEAIEARQHEVRRFIKRVSNLAVAGFRIRPETSIKAPHYHR